jgi:hypothetical protein
MKIAPPKDLLGGVGAPAGGLDKPDEAEAPKAEVVDKDV